MRIWTKIALLYTQLTFMVLVITFAAVYGITANRIYAEFYDQLWERAMMIAQVNYGKYEPSDLIYRHLTKNYPYSLNEEESFDFDADSPKLVDSLRTVVFRDKYLKELLWGKTVEYRHVEKQYVGIYYPAEVNHIIVVSAYDKLGADNMRKMLELLVIILVGSTLLVFLIGYFYAKRVMGPIRRIIDNVKSITANNLKHSLREEKGNDELSELSRTFNQMIGRLRTAFDMQNSFIRNASHELRNPLAAILGQTELTLNRPRSQEEYVQTLETVLEETERLNYTMQDLLMLAQTDFDFSRIKKEQADVQELFFVIRKEVLRSFPQAAIEIRPEGDRKYTVTGAISILRLALLNITGNAVKFSDGKPVLVSLAENQYGHILIEIIDRGIGIPTEELRHIFQPFYRGANTFRYKGTGIGLTLAKRIIELHEGHISIESQVGQGTKVTIRLDSQ
ncbi:MAG: HAMP domain-containing histidine kinase [Rikenellaceae bacterium]|nr:HAMP domain-containing histidine kinase [Rikenellaceae bacterium]